MEDKENTKLDNEVMSASEHFDIRCCSAIICYCLAYGLI